MKNITKTTVYVPVKVEDEKPKYGSKEFTIDSKNRKSVHHIIEILDENKDLYDKNGFLNFGEDNSYVTHWLKPQESFVFTTEQLNEYTASIIQQALETATEKSKLIKSVNFGWEKVDKQSITNTFEETFKLFQV
jgi:hypothetical protein